MGVERDFVNHEGVTPEFAEQQGRTAGSSPLTRHRRLLVMVVAGSLALAVLGLTAPFWIKSPQQLAAEAEPPPYSVLTAPVELRALRDTVVVRGDVTAGSTVSVTPGSRTGDSPVVTAVKVSQGDEVASGTVVLEVNARPRFVFPGAFPAFRDLKPGATGQDVAQLQAALAALGFDPGAQDGEFGPGTKQALTAFYRSRGYEPLPVSEDDTRLVNEARRRVTEAQRQLQDAQMALAEAQADPATTEATLASLTRAVTRAQEDLDDAQRALAEIQRTTGPMLPHSEYTFVPAMPARVDSLNATVGAAVVAPLVTFSSGDPIITGTLTRTQLALCKVGAPVEITLPDGLRADGVLASIGDREVPATPGGAGPTTAGYPFAVHPTEPMDARLIGQNLRLRIESVVSEEPSLVVPVSALYAGADGQTYVTVRADDGTLTDVVVVPGLSAQGYVAIDVPDGSLAEGDLVVIGLSGQS